MTIGLYSWLFTHIDGEGVSAYPAHQTTESCFDLRTLTITTDNNIDMVNLFQSVHLITTIFII